MTSDGIGILQLSKNIKINIPKYENFNIKEIIDEDKKDIILIDII